MAKTTPKPITTAPNATTNTTHDMGETTVPKTYRHTLPTTWGTTTHSGQQSQWEQLTQTTLEKKLQSPGLCMSNNNADPTN